MATLTDAINIWNENEAKRQSKNAALLVEQKLLNANFTKDAFENIGLVPDRIEGLSAVFQFEGAEVRFIVSKWKYGSVGVCRALSTCPHCGNLLFTAEYQLTLENVGWLLSSPDERFHECWGDEALEKQTVPEKTKAEKLVELITELIDERIGYLSL